MTDSPRAPGGRRGFLRRLLLLLGALWGAGFAAAAVSYLRLPRRLEPLAGGAVAAGELDALRPGQGVMITGDHRPFWLIRSPNGAAVALSAVCTHRRCILEWEEKSGRLLCPCHMGSFDINGNVLDGPPPRPLEVLSVAVKGGLVYVYV